MKYSIKYHDDKDIQIFVETEFGNYSRYFVSGFPLRSLRIKFFLWRSAKEEKRLQRVNQKAQGWAEL